MQIEQSIAPTFSSLLGSLHGCSGGQCSAPSKMWGLHNISARLTFSCHGSEEFWRKLNEKTSTASTNFSNTTNRSTSRIHQWFHGHHPAFIHRPSVSPFLAGRFTVTEEGDQSFPEYGFGDKSEGPTKTMADSHH